MYLNSLERKLLRYITFCDGSLIAFSEIYGVNKHKVWAAYRGLRDKGRVERCKCPICGKQHLCWGARASHLKTRHGWR